MPTVPNYSLPQEQERGLPSARRESVASPALLDAGAEQDIALGAGLQTAGSGVAAIAYHMAQRDNADALFATLAADKGAYIDYDTQVRKARQGSASKGVTADTAAWWKERIAKNVENLGNDAQRRLYAQHVTEVQLQSVHSMSQFEQQQTDIGQTANWNANKANTINLAAATPSDELVAQSAAALKQANAYRAAEKGWSTDVLKAQNEQDITALHTQVLQSLQATNKDVALAYFNAHKDEIAGSQRAELGQKAEQATAVAIGAKTAQAVWTQDGPKGDTEPASIDKMKARIRDELKDNTFARDAALHEISQMDADRDKGMKARDAGRTAEVNTMLMQGRSLAAVQQTPAWLALDGTERRKILEHEEAIGASRESRAAARENRAYTAEVRREHQLNTSGLDAMIRLSDPDKLVAMSRDDVINLRTTIGTENTKALLTKWDAYTKNGTALSEGKLDSDQFNVFAVRAGLDPNSKDDTMKKRIVDLRDKVERMVGVEQQSKKRALSREERDTLMQREIDNTVIQHSAVWFDKSVPALTLPTDKQADAYVVVGGKEVKLAGIPKDDRAAIIAARKAKGLPITEQAIAAYWLKKNAKAKQ